MSSKLSALLVAGFLAAVPIVLIASDRAALAQADTVEDRKAEADRLYQQSRQQFRDNQDEDSYREAFQLLEQALKIYQEIQDHSGEADALIGLGALSGELGQEEQALNFYQQALTIHREIDDREGMIEAFLKIGRTYQAQEQYQQAREQYQQAWKTAREIDDREAAIKQLIIIIDDIRPGRYEEQSNHTLVQDYLRQALDLAQTLQDSSSKAIALVKLGQFYTDLEQFVDALPLFQQARSIYQQQQNQKAELAMLKDLVDLYLSFDQTEQASQVFEDALEIARNLDDRQVELNILDDLVEFYLDFDQTTKALNVLEDTLKIAHSLGDRETEILILEKLSNVYFKGLNKPEQGIEVLQTALQVAREMENPKIELSVLERLNEAYSRQLNQPTQQLEILQAALEVVQRLENPKIEVEILRRLSNLYTNLNQLDSASETLQAALKIVQAMDDHEEEIDILIEISDLHSPSIQSINALQAALKIAQGMEDRDEEISLLEDIAHEYFKMNKFHEASQYLQEILAIYKELDELHEQPDVFLKMGSIEVRQGRIEQAESYFQQGLSLLQTASNQRSRDWWGTPGRSMASYLGRIGDLFIESGNYALGLKYYEKILTHYQELEVTINTQLARNSDDESGLDLRKSLEEIGEEKADTLQEIGWIYINQGQFIEAEQQFRQSIAVYQKLGDRREVSTLRDTIKVLQSGGVKAAQLVEAERLLEQAVDLARDGETSEGQQIFEQAIAIYQQSGFRRNEASALERFVGRSWWGRGRNLPPEVSLNYYQRVLEIDQELGNRYEEARTWGAIGGIYAELGQPNQTIDAYQQELYIYQELGDRSSEADSLDNLGDYYLELQQFTQAAEVYQKALIINRETCESGTWWEESTAMWGSGSLKTLITIHQNLAEQGGEIGKLGQLLRQAYQNIRVGQQQPAIQLLKDAIQLSRQNNPQQAALLTNQLGWLYADLNQPTEAIKHFQKALEFYREQDDRPQQVHLLSQMGWAYVAAGQTAKAVEAFQQVLTLQQTIGNPEQLATTYSILGNLFEKQGNPELAIIFYKEFVNQSEKLRQELQVLPRGQQGVCSQVSPDLVYRKLANLLLEEGRIPEAQQALDLLRLEELREFTQTTRATWTGSELRYTDSEQVVVDAHDSLIALGGEVLQCEKINCTERSALYAQIEVLKAQYDSQVREYDKTIRANRRDDDSFQDPNQLTGGAEALLKAYADNGQNAVLVYPFVLEDKLWLVWAVAGGVIGSIEVDVPQSKLATTVQHFGELLNSPSQLTELQTTSQQLYSWIVQPLEAEFNKYYEKYDVAERENHKIDHLIFVNDRVTRYIPMAALYDGEKYLLERFTISTVLTPALTDTSDRLTGIDQSQVLGLGVTKTVANFNPLPAVREELDTIVRSSDTDPLGTYPGQVFLDNDFTLSTLKENVLNYRVLHMATHAAFVPGRAEESFIVLGDGGKLTIADIEIMERRLSNLHLVVLSACQTALGGVAGDGTEIAGISSYFLEKGRAETVIASLWKVEDNTTSLLMQQFYRNLAQGMTKAEALQTAQLSLLHGQTSSATQTTRSDIDPMIASGREAVSRSGASGYAHPYYWAPFILIGNGL